MSEIRDRLDAAERTVVWVAWPERIEYGPGRTADEVARRHNAYLRSGYSRAGSGAYHNVRVAPVTLPESPEWRAAHPCLRAGEDPWGY